MLDEYVHGGVLYCYQCNVCTTECPVANAVGADKYNPRQNLLMAFEGLDYMLFGADKSFGIWGCTVCDTCDEKCPQNIELTAVFSELKAMSIQKGEGGEHLVAQAKTIMEHGKAIPLMSAIERRRDKMGLAKPPEMNLDDVKTLLTGVGLDKIIADAEANQPKEEA